MDLDEGATRDRDPEKTAVSGALCACSGAACRARGERKRWGQRVSERERESGSGDRSGEGSGVRARWGRPARASVACAWPAGGLRSALAGPVGLAGAWGFPFFSN